MSDWRWSEFVRLNDSQFLGRGFSYHPAVPKYADRLPTFIMIMLRSNWAKFITIGEPKKAGRPRKTGGGKQ